MALTMHNLRIFRTDIRAQLTANALGAVAQAEDQKFFDLLPDMSGCLVLRSKVPFGGARGFSGTQVQGEGHG